MSHRQRSGEFSNEADVHRAFTECIHSFSKNLREADDVAPDLRSQFFFMCTNQETLPS